MVINRCWNCMEDLGDKNVCPHCGFDPESQKEIFHALTPNTILRGRYLVGNILGQGGFGITYIGFDLVLEMRVAIKEYFPGGKATRNHLNGSTVQWRREENEGESWRNGCVQFLSEARKMAKINSIPGIVGVRDTFEENKTAYIVMDYVPGETMKNYMRKNGRFTFSDCIELMLPMIEGLDKVHRQGIIHRDISPDNLMITPDGKLYLLDLGAAKDMKDTRSETTSASKRGFSPIEQNASGGRIGPWTDVYALAASIYYCVYGKVVPSAMERFDEDTLTFEKGKGGLTDKQIAVLKKGLAIKPELRYQNAMEFYVALKESVQGKASGKMSKKKLAALIAGIAAAVALAVGISAFVTYRREKPWLPTAEVIGQEALLGANFARIENEYEYFTDLDNGLRCVQYDAENKAFYLDQAKVIYEQDNAIPDDGVTQVMLAENDLYFLYQGGKDGVDSLIRANLKGKNQETLLELDRNHSNLQYVKLSDGNEYFYYLLDENPEKERRNDEEADNMYLWRYSLQNEAAERVVQDQVQWFALYDRYVYYSVQDEKEDGGGLYRITFTGEDAELLDTVHRYFGGVVSDGRLYLLQDRNSKGESSMGLVACDTKGQPLEEGKGIFSIDWKTITWTTGGGWIYYNEKGSDELYRVRFDGTDKNRIFQGRQYVGLSYHDGVLYFQDGNYANDKFYPSQGYLADDGGDWVVDCGFQAKVLVTDIGTEYIIQDGKTKVVGYVGTSKDVAVACTFMGYPLDYNIDWDTFHKGDNVPEGFQLYLGMHSSELEYQKTTDGLIITGYSGEITGGFENIAVPGYIDDLKVVGIGENVFKGCTFKRLYLWPGLKEIGGYAFAECTNLEYVSFPNTLETLGPYAFDECSLKGQEIVLPNSLRTMHTGVFASTKPKSVYIPASVETVSAGFMVKCGGEYIVDPNNKKLKSEDGVIFSAGGASILAYPYDREGAYEVPQTVILIDKFAFWSCKVNNVIFHEGLTNIEKEAFKWCQNLTEIKLPKSLETLGEKAFYGTGLKTATMMRDVEGKDMAFEPEVELNYYKN